MLHHKSICNNFACCGLCLNVKFKWKKWHKTCHLWDKYVIWNYFGLKSFNTQSDYACHVRLRINYWQRLEHTWKRGVASPLLRAFSSFKHQFSPCPVSFSFENISTSLGYSPVFLSQLALILSLTNSFSCHPFPLFL